MPVDEMFDILPQDAAWGHEMAQDADGLELHYVRRGQGSPTVLLLSTSEYDSSVVYGRLLSLHLEPLLSFRNGAVPAV